MDTKHTPGPWFLGESVRDGSGCIVGDGDSVVCEFPDRLGGTVDADARLIAAAPELLELARAVADNLILATMGIGARARAAIAKATGEAA